MTFCTAAVTFSLRKYQALGRTMVQLDNTIKIIIRIQKAIIKNKYNKITGCVNCYTTIV